MWEGFFGHPVLFSFPSATLRYAWAAVVLSAEHLAPDRRARVRSSPGETLPYTLMAPSACKIRRARNVLQVPMHNYNSGSTKGEEIIPSVANQNCDGMSPNHP